MLTGELDETGFTPVCTPGVLDEPVLVPVVDPVPDSQHSVVDHFGAGSVVDSAVVIEESTIDSQSNADWLLGNCQFKLVFSVVGHVGVATNFEEAFL